MEALFVSVLVSTAPFDRLLCELVVLFMCSLSASCLWSVSHYSSCSCAAGSLGVAIVQKTLGGVVITISIGFK